jgi:hypothetical protein
MHALRDSGKFPETGEDAEVFDVTSLLRAIWDDDLNINITVLHDGIHNGQVSPSVIHGQLRLKQFGVLLGGVAINLDGSGGLIS